ncbi:MAG: hypothetical protein HQ523_13255 [Lentisphaerae bacterium]|nr:hypothetical protein [Lentisphaerota bacterium]
MLTLDKKHVCQDAELTLELQSRQEDLCTILDWEVHNTSPKVFEGVVVLQAPIPEGFQAPWIMIPAYLYGEETKAATDDGDKYPVLDHALKTPVNMHSSWWVTPADRTSSPLVYIHEGTEAFALAADPHYASEGDVSSSDPEPQVGIGFSPVRAGGFIKVLVPACEEPFTHTNAPDIRPTINRITMAPGSRVNGRIRIYEAEGDRHAYQPIIEHYYRAMAAHHEAAPLPAVEPLVADAMHGIVEGHYDEAGNYFVYTRSYDPVAEQIANARGCSLEWHQMLTGFVNGFPICHALIQGAAINDDARARAVALRVAEKFCRDGLSPSGLFWADWVPATVETRNGSFPNAFAEGRDAWGSGWLSTKTWVHSRTIADACDNLAAMILLEREHDPDATHIELWQQALRSNLDTALDLQLENGSYGQYYDAVQRRIVKEAGCGGLLWIPALIKARKVYDDDADFIARIDASLPRAAAAYAEYVEREVIWGAPEDNDSPTSEDGMNAVLAYCDLYELFEDQRYLDLATIAADWTLTFRKTYNERLPEDSLMGRYGMRSKGGDFASVANGHLHVFEVLCTRHLCNLSRWTDTTYYRDRAREHWAFVCQYLSRCDGMYNGFRGAMSEQFYWANWGSWVPWCPPTYHSQKGTLAAFSAVWCIAVLLVASADARREFYDEETE